LKSYRLAAQKKKKGLFLIFIIIICEETALEQWERHSTRFKEGNVSTKTHKYSYN
jgi:hypothetical protein